MTPPQNVKAWMSDDDDSAEYKATKPRVGLKRTISNASLEENDSDVAPKKQNISVMKDIKAAPSTEVEKSEPCVDTAMNSPIKSVVNSPTNPTKQITSTVSAPEKSDKSIASEAGSDKSGDGSPTRVAPSTTYARLKKPSVKKSFVPKWMKAMHAIRTDFDEPKKIPELRKETIELLLRLSAKPVCD